MTKIGILGGTFNPIHNGHIELGRAAVNELNLDRLLVMPSGVSYLKRDMNVLTGEHRYNMCALAIKDEPYFEISDLELKRSGNTYTYETLLELKTDMPDNELYFIIGADSLFYIENWVKADIIFQNCTLCCANRGNNSSTDELEKCKNYLVEKYDAKIELLNSSITDISSTKIRTMVNESYDEKEITQYIPFSVYQYIMDNKLYQI